MVAPRLAFSAARIFNLPRVNCESFGSSGWELPLSQQKKLADWLISQGINLFIPHRPNYSIENYRKRDHPPAFNTCAYFPYLSILNDYIGRICSIFSRPRTKGLSRVILLQGTESVLATITPMKTEHTQRTHDAYPYIVDILQRLHVDFDIAPEFYIAGLQIHGNLLADDHNSYDLVIIPSVFVIAGSTLETLLNWAQQGGNVLFIDCIPIQTTLQNEQGLLDQVTPQVVNFQNLADSENSGGFTLLSSPKEPIYLNNLLPPIQNYLKSHHQQGLMVGQLDEKETTFIENGNIVALQFELDAEMSINFIFLANLSIQSFTDVNIRIQLEEMQESDKKTVLIMDTFDGA